MIEWSHNKKYSHNFSATFFQNWFNFYCYYPLFFSRGKKPVRCPVKILGSLCKFTETSTTFESIFLFILKKKKNEKKNLFHRDNHFSHVNYLVQY